MKRTAVLVGFAVGAALLAFVGARRCADALDPFPVDEDERRPIPTDAELRATFFLHRADLDELRDLMLAEHEIQRVARTDTDGCGARDERWHCVPIDEARRARYVELLAALGAKSIQRGPRGFVGVDVFSAGIVTSGTSKSIEWWPQDTPSPIVGDTEADAGRGYVVSHAALDGRWFIGRVSN